MAQSPAAGSSSQPTNTSTPPTPQTSPLLSLPAELRNIIYTHVLSNNTYAVTSTTVIPWLTTSVSNSTTSPHALALLRTNRQIHAETRLLPFALNTFQFTSEEAFAPWLAKFDKEQCAAMAWVRLVTWKARYMVERKGFLPKRVGDVFPVGRFEGLRRVVVEVRYNEGVGEGEKWAGGGCELEDREWEEQEGRLRLRWGREVAGLQVRFERVAV
ncbi:hypothetical protein B5807_04086 [Epicoccum nigrum]|uniref:Uncharacterized protein n=1 Tax=Epicoccum nigrum TaxID=105696 RepID=A0A1Y2M4K1_EPING|nr:hypothetical protein B5807_04086 [Epicoccum nigrum]